MDAYVVTALIVLNLAVIWHIFRTTQVQLSCLICKHSLVILISGFDENNHNLSPSISYWCESIPDALVMVYSHGSLYPPPSWKHCGRDQVMFFTDDVYLSHQSSTRLPLQMLQMLSNYPKNILIVTDEARVRHSFRDNLINYPVSEDDVLVLSSNLSEECYRLVPDLKRWTLTFVQDVKDECDFRNDSNVGFLLSAKNYAIRLQYPFLVPFHESMSIQSKIGQLNLIYSNTSMFIPAIPDSVKEVNHNQRLSMYKKFGIKKVIFQRDSFNKTEWFGHCHKHSSRCFDSVINDMPDYLFKDRWTPPCCLTNLRATAKHVFKIFDLFDIRYWLEGGSLLGAVRNGQIIDWDYDVDIGVYEDDLIKLNIFKATRDVGPVIDEKGFVWERAIEGDFYRVQFSRTNRLHVDIFPFRSRNGTMTKDTWFRSHPQDMEFPERFLVPLETISFMRLNVSVPNNAREFLELKFGKGCIENPELPDHTSPWWIK